MTAVGGRGFAALALLAVASCAVDGSDTSGSDTSGSGDSDADQAVGQDADQESASEVDLDAAIGAAIDVRVTGCGPHIGFGTGSVIDDGFIVTVAHVVAGARELEVIDTDGMSSAANVVLFDPDLDLAILSPANPIGHVLSVRPTTARAGESGVVILPRLTADGITIDIADVRVVRTVTIETTDIYLDVDVHRPGFEVEGSIDPGDSGAMVILPGGGAGVIWARSTEQVGRAWAIDLPPAVLDGSALDRSDDVDTGPCRPT